MKRCEVKVQHHFDRTDRATHPGGWVGCALTAKKKKKQLQIELQFKCVIVFICVNTMQTVQPTKPW